MPGRNGTAAARRVYHAIPKTSPIPIEVDRDGEPVVVEFTGHHKDRCLVWVQIEVEAAWQRWRQDSYVDNDEGVEVVDPSTGEKTVPTTILRENSTAEATLRRDMLTAVIHDADGRPLPEAVADVLARDGGEWREILEDLGWLDPIGESARPEAGGGAGAPTGSPSSPAPAPSTAPTTGSR